jgi:hypothetical protein
MKKQRDELRLALLDLLTQSPNEILETCEETEDEWGFIECINDKGQEIKLVFKENPVVEVYIDGIQQNGIE